jgi:DNA-binding PadR family transcriptional regulator
MRVSWGVTLTFRRSGLALAILGLLDPVGPMHPYGIQRLIKQRGKDQVGNVVSGRVSTG